MIVPKTPKPSPKEEQEAYDLCTLRDNRKCVRCGSNDHVQRDHRRNRQPGNTVISNLQLLCAVCHSWKTTNPADAKSEGFAVPSAIHDPREYPARRLVFGQLLWVLYGGGTTYAVIPEATAMAVRARLGVE